MDSINKFYSTYTIESEKHEYDIPDLGMIRAGGEPLISFSDGRGNFKHFRSSERKTTAKDYDELFGYNITTVEPVYNLMNFLDYHFQQYLNAAQNDTELFLNHIRYLILPYIEKYPRKEAAQIIIKWLTKNEKMSLTEQLRQKNELLNKAYEAAFEYAPSSPLSVTIDVQGISETMNYSIATTKRIINELVADGYITSPLGMKIFMVTREGLRHLQKLHISTDNKSASVNFQVGNNSIVQFQQGTNHSQQKLQMQEATDEDLLLLVREIKANVEILKQHLSAEQMNVLLDDANYLESNLNRTNPNKITIKAIANNVFDMIKAVPANVIADIITSHIPM